MPRKRTSTLTNAEHRIMEVIWARGSATVAEVVQVAAGQQDAAAAPKVLTYTVQPSDSLVKIAAKVYGSGHEKEYKRIFETHPDKE